MGREKEGGVILRVNYEEVMMQRFHDIKKNEEFNTICLLHLQFCVCCKMYFLTDLTGGPKFNCYWIMIYTKKLSEKIIWQIWVACKIFQGDYTLGS